MAASKRARARPDPDLVEAEKILRRAIGQSDQVVTLKDVDGRVARREVTKVLKDADRRLATRLAYLAKTGRQETFTAAQAKAYKAQLDIMLRRVQGKLAKVTDRTGSKAIDKAVERTARTVARLEKAFNGVTIAPSVLAAMRASPGIAGINALLVTRVATSLDRYGKHMGQRFGRVIAAGLASGATVDQMIATLVRGGGPRGTVSLAAREMAPGVVQRVREGHFPQGLFRANQYWAERIVRTEVANAYSASSLASMQALRDEGEPVQKKIVAVFDSRTAFDSIAVHGQIRELDQPFMDGAGRVYQHPPARPNDRETIIAWYEDWPETRSTRPKPRTTVERAQDAEKPPIKPSVAAKPAKPTLPKPAVVKAGMAARPKEPPVPARPAPHDVAGWMSEFQRVHDEAVAGMKLVDFRYQGDVPDSYTQFVLAQRDAIAQHFGLRSTRPLTRVTAMPPKSVDPSAGYMKWNGEMQLAMSPMSLAQERNRQHKTLVHEAIHTMGGVSARGYRGVGAVIEESATEHLASVYSRVTERRVSGPTSAAGLPTIRTSGEREALRRDFGAALGRRLPVFESDGAAGVGGGTYKTFRQHIKAAIAVGKRTTEPVEVQSLMTAASKRWKARAYDTPEEAAAAFVDALQPSSPDERAWYEEFFRHHEWPQGAP